MSNTIETRIQTLIAGYLGLAVDKVDMSADLDTAYEMDSTELTDFAKAVEKEFGISISKTDRKDWDSGKDISSFVANALNA